MTRRRTALESLALLGLAAILLWAAGAQQARLAARRAAQSPEAMRVLESAPPLVAFTTVVLGGFRGLLADILWLHASQLQDEGRYFELVQIADWITKLEPHIGEVWSFHAWNMAYNVSAMMPEAETRWRWVENGIRLLRNEGVVYDAHDPDLYFELAWMFFQKIAGPTDSANLYFKVRWAEAMNTLLGGAHPDYTRIEEDPSRLHRLTDRYKLDPKVMREVDELYGPLDWRLAESQSLYWAYEGKQQGAPPQTRMCDRLIYQTMAQVFQGGHLDFDPRTETFRVRPAPELFPKACRAFEAAIAAQRDSTMRAAYANFLQRAVLLFHDWGQDDRAREAFARLQQTFPSPATQDGFEFFLEKASQVWRRAHGATP